MKLFATRSLEMDASPHQLLQGKATFPYVRQRGRPWAGAWPCRGERSLIPRTRKWCIKLCSGTRTAGLHKGGPWLAMSFFPPAWWGSENQHGSSAGWYDPVWRTPCKIYACCRDLCPAARKRGAGLKACMLMSESGCKSTFSLCEWHARLFRWKAHLPGGGGEAARRGLFHGIYIFILSISQPFRAAHLGCFCGWQRSMQSIFLTAELSMTYIYLKG